MYTIYRLNADELDASFLEGLKAAFAHKEIEIAVAEADETEYLLRSPANREKLLQAVADVEAGKKVVAQCGAPVGLQGDCRSDHHRLLSVPLLNV